MQKIYILVAAEDQSDACDREYVSAAPAFDDIVAVSFDRTEIEALKAAKTAEDAKLREDLETNETFYTIVEKEVEVPVHKIAVYIDGGLVQSIRAYNSDVDVEVFDLDVSDVPESDAEVIADAAKKEERWNAIEADPAWKEVF